MTQVGTCVFMYPLFLSTMRMMSVYTLARELLSTMTLAAYESNVGRRQLLRWEYAAVVLCSICMMLRTVLPAMGLSKLPHSTSLWLPNKEEE